MKILLNKKFFALFLFPFILGSLTILGFSPYDFTLINFISFPLLLFLILNIKKKINSKYRQKKLNYYFFYLGCSFGFGFFLFGNYWISISLTHDEMFKNLIPLAITLIPLFLCLFFGFAILIIGKYSEISISFIFIFSLIFSIFEFLRGNLFTGFPWNLMAYSWSWSAEIFQILSLIGTYSFSLISITIFCTPFLFFKNKNINKNSIYVLVIMVVFIGNYFYGFNKINDNDYNFDNDISVKIISPNFSLKEYNANTEISQLKKLIRISDPEKDKKTIFIWPEGIFYKSYLQDIDTYKNLFINKFSKNHLIVIGINNFSNEKYFNSLVVLNHKLEIQSVYNKINLVPFGEFLPFEELFSKVNLKKVTRGYNSFSAGNFREIINLGLKFNEKLVLPLICYEVIYPGKIKTNMQFPDLAINISEDAWFGKSIGPQQHFAKVIYRSVEEGIFIARSANKGISAFINPNGKVIKSLYTGESGNIEINFPNFYTKTFFSHYGNKIFYLIIFLYMFLIIIFRKCKI